MDYVGNIRINEIKQIKTKAGLHKTWVFYDWERWKFYERTYWKNKQCIEKNKL